MRMYTCISICICICSCCICTCIYICVYKYMYTDFSINIDMYSYICTYIGIIAYVGIYACSGLCLRLRLFLHLRLHVHVGIGSWSGRGMERTFLKSPQSRPDFSCAPARPPVRASSSFRKARLATVLPGCSTRRAASCRTSSRPGSSASGVRLPFPCCPPASCAPLERIIERKGPMIEHYLGATLAVSFCLLAFCAGWLLGVVARRRSVGRPRTYPVYVVDCEDDSEPGFKRR